MPERSDLPGLDNVAIRTVIDGDQCYANLDDLLVWLGQQGDCDHLAKVLRDAGVLWRLEVTE